MALSSRCEELGMDGPFRLAREMVTDGSHPQAVQNSHAVVSTSRPRANLVRRYGVEARGTEKEDSPATLDEASTTGEKGTDHNKHDPRLESTGQRLQPNCNPIVGVCYSGSSIPTTRRSRGWRDPSRFRFVVPLRLGAERRHPIRLPSCSTITSISGRTSW